jgi:anaerobic dimethyl sulfoxide reductase subunit B
MDKRYIIRFTENRCIGCFACEIACEQWHGIKAGTFKLRRVDEIDTGTFPDVKTVFKSISCRHCAEPSCIAVCPVEAISQRAEDGIVIVDSEKWNGCRACLEACPYGIPEFDENGKMQKCDMCLERITSGQPPICVATCPTQALRWDR